jgi:glycosyltransferase involved in cell wall biosynthesis
MDNFVSVLYPCRDDLPLLKEVVANLCEGQDLSKFEVIICDDGTKDSGGRLKPIIKEDFPYPNIKVINNNGEFGVGYSFDRCFDVAKGSIIVLAGSDTFPRRSWLSDVKTLARQGEIGCACSIGLTPDNRDLDKSTNYKRYGAELLLTVGMDDLPSRSSLRRLNGGYSALFEARWASKRSDEPYEIPCLLGAFYWTTREFYEKIHGWDTEAGVRFMGHQNWGSLEPYLSLKTKVYGGKLMMYPDFEVGHVFNRIATVNLGNFQISSKRVARGDLHWWNRLFIAHTMFDDPLKSELLNFPLPEYNLDMAKKYIQQYWNNVLKVRERNIREGKLINAR